MSVARAVRRRPSRSSAARGVTATVSSHSPAANGRKMAESASMRTIASPPGIQPSAEVRMEKSRTRIDTAMASVASSIAIADPTARRRRRSTSTRRKEAPITRAGSATTTASHSRASLIPIASVDGGRAPRGQNGVAQPLVEPRQQPCEPGKGVDDHTVQSAVEESTLECNQEEALPYAIRRHRLEAHAAGSRTVADRVFDSMQIVENVRGAQELEQPKAGVSGEMDERDRVPA